MNQHHPANSQVRQTQKMRKVSDDDRHAMRLLGMCVNDLRDNGMTEKKIGRVLYALRHHCRIVAESIRNDGAL